MNDLLALIEDSGLARLIRESTMLYPLVEAAHIAGLAVLVGAAVALDARLIGAGATVSARSATRLLLPLVWTGFATAAITGTLLFAANATLVATNSAFQVKLALLAVAGLNALVFHRSVGRRVATWDTGPPPVRARVAGAVSTTVWLGVIVCGRLIAYV